MSSSFPFRVFGWVDRLLARKPKLASVDPKQPTPQPTKSKGEPTPPPVDRIDASHSRLPAQKNVFEEVAETINKIPDEAPKPAKVGSSHSMPIQLLIA